MLLLAASGSACAGSVFVNGRIVTTMAPPEYCEVGYSAPERRLIASLSPDSGQLLSVFVLCRELEQIKAGTRRQAHHYGYIWAASGPPLDMSRAQYLELWKDGNKREGILPQQKGLQLLGVDQYGAFVGRTGRAKLDSGRVGNVAGAMGYTVVADHLYSVNYFMRSASEPILGMGHDTLAPLVESFVKANGD